MKHICLIVIAILFSVTAYSQTNRLPAPVFNSYEIGGGFKAHFPAEPVATDRGFNYTQDSSAIYTANVKYGTFHFDVVAIKMSEPIRDDEKQEILVDYMDFLKTIYDIDGTTGFSAGQKLLSHPTAKGTIDYWEDKDTNKAVVMGWVDTDYMAVLILWGPGQYPYYDAQNAFLNGIRFPGDN